MLDTSHDEVLDNLVIEHSPRRRALPDQSTVYDAITFDYVQLGFHRCVMMRLGISHMSWELALYRLACVS